MKKTTALALALSSVLALGFLGLQVPSFGQDGAAAIRYEVTTRDGKVFAGKMTDKGGTLVIQTDDGEVSIDKSEVKTLRRLGQPKVDLGPAKPLPPLPVAPKTPPSEDPPAETPPAEQPPAEAPPAEAPPPVVTPPAEAPPAEKAPVVTPPAEPQDPPAEPPAEQPPAETPPAEAPPAEAEPPVKATPAEPQDPPAEQPAEPPAETPPAETPPAEQPPAETPPAETPPAETPPAETPAEPPAETPPAEQPQDPPAEPPAEQPPAETPPAETPPAETPPAEAPPAETPPAETPPADTPPKKPEVAIALEDRVIQILTRDERRIIGRAVDTGSSFRVATKDGMVEVSKSEIISFKFTAAPEDAPALPRDAFTRPVDPPEPGPKEVPPVVTPPVETPPAETPPAETPPVETPPAETPPAETPPSETPPAETPPSETPPSETPKVAPPGEPVPAPTAPAPAAPAAPAPSAPAPSAPAPATTPAGSEPAVGTEARAELSLYKEALTYDELIQREEEEFGPIDFGYRGPLELTLSGGAYIFDGGVAESKLDNGGSGSARLTFNLGATNGFAFELYFGMTRTNYRVRLDQAPFGTNPDGSSLFNRNKAFIYFGDANIVLRPSGLAFDYAQLYVSIGGSIAYFDRFRGSSPENDYGYGGNIELGIDYKLDRTWSLKLGAKGRVLYSRVLRDRDSGDTDTSQRLRYIFEPTFGIVIHFE